MQHRGTIMMMGVAFHVYCDAAVTMEDVWENHIHRCEGDVFIFDEHVRLVEVDNTRSQDDYADIPATNPFD